MTEAEQAPPGVDITTPSPARLYDYYLGGTANYEVDRIAGEKLKAALPDLYDAAWANRGFHQRAARWMAREQGISQFIDVGSGLPTQGNTHESVRQVIPGARVMYVDHDPMVRMLSAQLLENVLDASIITADMRDPDAVLDDPALRTMIDFSQPVGLLMTAVLHFVADGSDPWGLVKRYASALPAGSYLALSHATADRLPPRSVQAIYDTYKGASEQIYLRTLEEVTRLFDGLEITLPYEGAAEAAVTYVGVWGADDPEAADTDGSRVVYCGVARRA
ncbi:MAG TPA: SAM-dependent methyltransferase [Streptosporangiaceae bacterium]